MANQLLQLDTSIHENNVKIRQVDLDHSTLLIDHLVKWLTEILALKY